MFENAELGNTISEKEYDATLPKLRERLLQAHLQLRGRDFPVVVIVSGGDAAGKGELVHRLNEWLDPRGVETHAFWALTEEESEHPPYWRFWRAMPGRGRMAILFGSWYSDPILRRTYGRMKSGRFDVELDRIAAFERMLVEDGALIVKLWLHLPKTVQKKRLEKLAAKGRLAPDEWDHFKHYDAFRAVSERAIRHTDSAEIPWNIVEATDRNYRELTTAQILVDALERRLARGTSAAKTTKPAPAAGAARRSPRESILDHVDLTSRLRKSEYKEKLEELQDQLARLAWLAHEKRRSMVLVFEGWDAAGKGSAIRRVTQAMDPRLYRTVGVAAPTDEERAQHYLWRFWRQLPRGGQTTIFDRSWYGRVLVERVEGFASVPEWTRSYQEINQFEEQLVEHGTVLVKFWLHISRDEQLRRFKERESVSYKQHKITAEDWRNREKWPAYQAAVDEMIVRCSTEFAPWTIVAGNDKRFARVQILKTVTDRLAAALKRAR